MLCIEPPADSHMAGCSRAVAVLGTGQRFFFWNVTWYICKPKSSFLRICGHCWHPLAGDSSGSSKWGSGEWLRAASRCAAVGWTQREGLGPYALRHAARRLRARAPAIQPDPRLGGGDVHACGARVPTACACAWCGFGGRGGSGRLGCHGLGLAPRVCVWPVVQRAAHVPPSHSGSLRRQLAST